MRQNYGYVKPVPQPTDYVFGASRLPKTILLPDGKWVPYAPTYEPQVLPNGEDTHGCTVWGTQNGYETILKFLTDKEWNLSERFLYILLRIRPPGADPIKVAQAFRDFGSPENVDFPVPATFAEFITPDPLPQSIKDKAKEILKQFDFGYEYVWHGPISLAEKRRRITEYIQYGPLGVSLFAWEIDENGMYYRPEGEPDTHWCLLLEEQPDCDIIFDTYDQALKKVRKDMNYEVCIRYAVMKRTSAPTHRSFLQLLLAFLNPFK